MKRWKKITAVLSVLSIVLNAQASAQSLIMTGNTALTAKGVTILVTQKGKSVDALKSEDIVWLDQASVNSDGSFAIRIPLFSENDYDFHSNALSYEDEEKEGMTVFVSGKVQESGLGLDASQPTTLESAYNMLDAVTEIVIVDDVTYVDVPSSYTGNLKIKGNLGTEVLTLPEAVNVKGNLTIDNLAISGESTIYANGYNLEIGSTVTSTTQLTVYGGKNGKACESTSVRLYGGQYAKVYGGGKDSGVTGKTEIIFGGNANARYLIGAGSGEKGTATDTNINISGGQVMNVYAGGVGKTVLSNCDTHINMTGGVAEALFGGSEKVSMTGNSYITVKGGEVLRRIYGGCYNDHDGSSWADTDYHVKGSTNIILYPEANLITGTGLSWADSINMGIFGGSRKEKALTDEINTIIFLDGSYSTFADLIGEQGSWYKTTFNSFHNYIVDSATGGSVKANKVSDSVIVSVNQGKSAVSGGKRYFEGQEIPLNNNAVTVVNYEGITSAELSETSTDIHAQVGVVSSAAAELFVAIYDSEGKLVSCGLTSVDSKTSEYEVNINCKLEKNKKYTAKLFLMDGKTSLVPIATNYCIQIR